MSRREFGGFSVRIGDLLVSSGFISEQDLDSALRHHSARNTPIGQLLKLLNLLKDDELELVLQAQRRILFASMSDELAVESLKYARQHRLSFAQATEHVISTLNGEKQAQALESFDPAGAPSSMRLSGLKPQGAKFAVEPAALIEQSDRAAGEKNWDLAISLLEQANSLYELQAPEIDELRVPVYCRLAALYSKTGQTSNSRHYINKVTRFIEEGKKISPGLVTLLAAAASLCFRNGMRQEADRLYRVVMPKWTELLPFELKQFNICLRDAIACRRSVEEPRKENIRIGELLSRAGLINASQFQESLNQSKQQRRPLGRILSENNQLKTSDLRDAMKVQLMCRASILPADYAVFAVRAASLSSDSAEFFERLKLPEEFPQREKASIGELISKMDALLLLEASRGLKDPDVAILANEVGDLCLRREEFEEAEAMYRRAHAILAVSGDNHREELADVCQKIGKLLIQQKKYPESELLFLQAMEIKSNLYEETDQRLASVLQDVGYIYFCQANFEPAIGFLRSAWALSAEETSSEDKQNLLQLLIKCYEQSGQTQEADIYKEQLKSLRTRES